MRLDQVADCVDREAFFQVLRRNAAGQTPFALVVLFVPNFLYRERFARQPWDPETDVASIVRTPSSSVLATRTSWSQFWLLLSVAPDEAADYVKDLGQRLREPVLAGAWRLSYVSCSPPVDYVDSLITDVDWLSDKAAEANPSSHTFIVDVRKRAAAPLPS